MDPLSVTAGIIACLQLTGTLLKRFGPSDHCKHDLEGILKTIEGFHDLCNDLKSRLTVDPENEVRRSAIQHLDKPLQLCKEALEFLQSRLDGPTIIGQYVVGIKWDNKFKKCLQRLNDAKDLLKFALCNDGS